MGMCPCLCVVSRLSLCRKYQDLSTFVVQVDLVHHKSLAECNCLNADGQSPSISSARSEAYPPTVVTPTSAHPPNYPTMGSITDPSTQYYSRNAYMNGSYTNTYNGQQPPLPTHPQQNGYGHSMYSDMDSRINGQNHQGVTNCTRTLLGSLWNSAFKLKDVQDRMGLWFVFQDLSIRIEDIFRLKFTFYELDKIKEVEGAQRESKLKDYSPMLALSWSKPFKVYSAKKFPGVIKGTPLSRKFADQGIKISIRKDTKNGKRRRDGEDDGEVEDDDGQEEEG